MVNPLHRICFYQVFAMANEIGSLKVKRVLTYLL